ncbi:MAG: hypothetical protein M3Y13_11645 [Armatimonadota bacterium]|nr:hypothetical protein [Armatimonadota bacterium]
MRRSRDLVAVLLLIALFLAGGLLLGGRGAAPARTAGAEAYPDPSITNDRASGSKGAFEWTEKLGYRPVAWRQSWTRLSPSESGVLLVIDPEIEESFTTLTGNGGSNGDRTTLGVQDAATLRHWLASGQGHTAILLTSRLPSGRSGPKPSAGDQVTFGDALDLIVESASPATRRAEFAPLQPVADMQGILSLYSASGTRINRARPDGLALFGDNAGSLALEIPVGRGRLVAIADSRLFSNDSLPKSENAVFLANLLAHYGHPHGAVLFDEYHHGDVAANTGGSIWESLGRPLQLAFIQFLLAALCLMVLLGGRFGPPVPLVRNMTRTSAEYVTSLASLYRRAEASGTALETLYRQFLRDVCGRLALPPDVNLERLAEVAARRGQVKKDRFRRLLATCELRLDQGKVTEAELLDLTRQMESIRKELGIA